MDHKSVRGVGEIKENTTPYEKSGRGCSPSLCTFAFSPDVLVLGRGGGGEVDVHRLL